MNKKILRKEIYKMRQTHTAFQEHEAGIRIAEKLAMLPQYQNASTLYCYVSYNHELSTQEIMRRALAEGKRVAVPKVVGRELRFYYISHLSETMEGYKGIPEPPPGAAEAQAEAALVIVPGVAFDKAGNRIGYGGGFYDRFLSQEPNHTTIGIGYEFQIFEALTPEAWDIPMDLVLWT